RGERWVNIGPAPILGENFCPISPPCLLDARRPTSGRVAAIAVEPADPAHWLIGAALGGIWETRDGGATWIPKTDDQASLAMGAIAFAPSDQNVIYAGTGEVASAQGYFGAGLLKSTRRGTTRHLLASSTI